MREKNLLLFKINDFFWCWRFFKFIKYLFIVMFVLGWFIWLFIVLILFYVVCLDNFIFIVFFVYFCIIWIYFWFIGSKGYFVRLILWKVCCFLSVFYCVLMCYIIEWEFNVLYNVVFIEWVFFLYKNWILLYYKYFKCIWCFVLC